MERLIAIDPSNVQWLVDVIEYNYDLAINGDDSIRRFLFIAAVLRDLQKKNALTSEQEGWLLEAEKRLAQGQN
jgi:hypothetical protein